NLFDVPVGTPVAALVRLGRFHPGFNASSTSSSSVRTAALRVEGPVAPPPLVELAPPFLDLKRNGRRPTA
ncbi:MAG: hypothetical protein AB7I30_09965, partial [Isosphaeraceae bacterium]